MLTKQSPELYTDLITETVDNFSWFQKHKNKAKEKITWH
jgi:hypothetical protein